MEEETAPACLLPAACFPGGVTCAARSTETAAWRDAAADLDELVDKPATRPRARR